MQTLKVDGMTCGHCERAVTAAIRTLDPHATVKVDLASGRVETGSDLPPDRLADAIRAAGYGVGVG